MKDFPIPVVAFGTGSQSVEDEGLEFLPMPKAEPLATPVPPDDAAPEELTAAADVIEQLMESMRRHRPGKPGAPRFSLKAMPPGALRALNESLGQGEVSAVVGSGNGVPGWRVQETAFAGVWRVQREDGQGNLAEDILEADDMPGQSLQLDRNVLKNVSEIRSAAQSLKETAALSDAAPMLDHRGQPRHQPVIEAGNFFGGFVFELAQVHPDFQDRKIRPNVRTTKCLNFSEIHDSCA